MPSRTKILNNRVTRRLQADLGFFLPFLTTRCPVPVLPGRPAMPTLLAGDDARLALRHGCRIIVQSRPTANRRAGRGFEAEQRKKINPGIWTLNLNKNDVS